MVSITTDLKVFYGTFGQSHIITVNGKKVKLKDWYITIYAPDYDKAFDVMYNHFGETWANIYRKNEFSGEYYINGSFERIIYSPSSGKFN